jgi:hypothetical protein
MLFSMSGAAKRLPILLSGLCFIAFPIGLSRCMMVEDLQRLSLAVLGVGCWMVVVWLGLLWVASDSINSLRPPHLVRRTIKQLLFFVMGVVLMLAAIVLSHGTV